MFGVGSIPWSPLARGLLTRPVAQAKTTSRANSDLWATTPSSRNACTDPLCQLVQRLRRKWDCRRCEQVGAMSSSGSLCHTHRYTRVEELANKKGVTMAQIATAWCLAKDEVTAPIVGTTKLENLQEILSKSLSVSLCKMWLIGTRCP